METYLALRQQLKQSIRAQMQRDDSGGGATDHSIAGDSRNNYGCFFGPSETVLTGNAEQEISNLWSKFTTGQIDFKKTAKPTVTVDAAAMKRRKVQRFKESRDYSFLSSSFEGDEICTTTPPQKRDLILKKPMKLIVKLGGSVITKNPTKSTEKGSNGKRDDQKSNPSWTKKESKKSNVSVSKQQQRPEQKKKKEGEGQERKSSVEKREREEEKQPEKKMMKKKEGEGQKRRPVEKREKVEDEENVAINLIREMFGYDPTTFSDDDEEDLKMEASFADIEKEERRSAKIATMEDREELRKLEAAESCRKKRKLINF